MVYSSNVINLSVWHFFFMSYWCLSQKGMVLSVKACAPYPGRSVCPLHEELWEPEGERKGVQKSAKGIVKLLDRRSLGVSDRTQPLEDRERKEGTCRVRSGGGGGRRPERVWRVVDS